MRSEIRVKVRAVANEEWQGLCAQARASPDPDALLKLDRNRSQDFEKLIDYDDQKLAVDLIPSYRRMLTIFRDNFWLAEPETRPYFPKLLEFVDMWDRWLANSVPIEVVRKLGHSESSLHPFYDHLETKHDALRSHLSEGGT
jgi:hypothetical protein